MASEVVVKCEICGLTETIKVGESGNKETALTPENIAKAFRELKRRGWFLGEHHVICPTHTGWEVKDANTH